MKSIHTTIFTDGSSRGNPGPGGWAAIVIEGQQSDIKRIQVRKEKSAFKIEHANGQIIELGGYDEKTTNNRMELTAVLKGITHSKIGAKVVIFSDSSYVLNGITKWIKGWKRNGWMTKTKEAVLNRDLWEKLDEEVSNRKVEWKYVGGHVGVVGNERCDHIATDFADGNRVELYKGPISEYDLPNILNISVDQEKTLLKKSDSSRARTKAYSYVSIVQGVIETHHSWPECERRVKRARGAKYKKALDSMDEARIIEEFGAL
jgi:ribonuclease HI